MLLLVGVEDSRCMKGYLVHIKYRGVYACAEVCVGVFDAPASRCMHSSVCGC